MENPANGKFEKEGMRGNEALSMLTKLHPDVFVCKANSQVRIFPEPLPNAEYDFHLPPQWCMSEPHGRMPQEDIL
jgi:hypothetical protein